MGRLIWTSVVIIGVAICGCSSSQDNPCGNDPYSTLPACTSALEGVECGREACACCADHWTCHSGVWDVTGVNGSSCADASSD